MTAAGATKPILSLLLAFKDAQKEAMWQLFFAQKRLYFDKIGLYASLLQLIPGTVIVIGRGYGNCLMLCCMSWLLHGVHGCLLAYPRYYQQHRTAIVLGLLAFGRAITALLIPGCSADSTTTTRLLYKTGAIPLMWYSLIMPLPFCYQVLAQLLAAILYQRHLVVSGCSMLLGDAAIMAGLHRVFSMFRHGLSYLLMLQGVTADVDVTSQLSDMHACWGSITLLHLLCGVLLPLPVWYLLELRLRRLFYAQEAAAEVHAQLQQQQQSSQAASTSSSSSCCSSSCATSTPQQQVYYAGHNSNSSAAVDAMCIASGQPTWEDVFHVPAAAVVLHVLAMLTVCLLGFYKLGPYVLQMHGIATS